MVKDFMRRLYEAHMGDGAIILKKNRTGAYLWVQDVNHPTLKSPYDHDAVAVRICERED